MELPEEMIQHIQYFLNIKEATQTTSISKLWNKAWVTRSNLVFSLLDFKRQTDFVRVTKRTLERYEDSKQKIQRFRLCLQRGFHEDSILMSRDMVCLGIEWIKKAMKLDATHVDIGIYLCRRWSQNFILPREVLESESLVQLSLVGGKIDGQTLKVSCSRLKTLDLCKVCIQDNTLLNIISMCPLIEHLKLSFAHSRMVLKSGWGVNDLLKLKLLWLNDVEIGEWFFLALSKSPYLKDLRLNRCTGFEEIQICSDSLEFITISCSWGQRISRAKFDVPRIRKFIFEDCLCVPSLCFKTSSREWESSIFFKPNVFSSRFLVKIRNFLLELSSSKIYFDLWTYISRVEEEEEGKDMTRDISKPPMVDILVLTFEPSSFSIGSNALMDLFWSFRPKIIALCLYLKPYDLAKLICDTTIKEERESRNTSSLHDLEKVDVKIVGQIAWTWSRGCPVPTNTQDELGDMDFYWRDTQVCLQWR